MTDLFWEAVPDAWIARVLEVALAAPRHTYLLLTKRPDRMRRFFEAWLPERRLATVPDHIWVGATVGEPDDGAGGGSRNCWPSRRPCASSAPSPCSGRSTCGRGSASGAAGGAGGPAVRWVITGGESGGTPARRLVERRRAARRGRWGARRPAGSSAARRRVAAGAPRPVPETQTAFLLKQLGGPTPKAGGRALDGVVWHQYPDGSGFVRPVGEVA